MTIPSRSTWRGRLGPALTAAAMILVVWFYYWTVAANSGFENWGDMDYYRLLVRGWKKGHLYLDKEPAPELLALQDPYDPNQNERWKLGDATLYRGKYYIYFGPAPALTLMLPYSVLTGGELTMGAATFVFCSVAFLAASALWLAIRRHYFPESRWWMGPCGVLAIGFGTHLLALAQRPMIWELPISSGIAYTLLALNAVYWTIHGRRPLLTMALAGLCLGLAVGSRPTALFASGMLLAPLWLAWREKREGRSDRSWWRMGLAAAAPIGLCGLAIMAHNYARFENPLEWGQKYQLSGAYEGKLVHFSARFFLHNLSIYFFHPLRWTPEFPFALAEGYDVPSIPDYFGTEEVCGLAVTFPFFWFLLALPWAWAGRGGEERRRLTLTIGAVTATALPVMVLVLCYFSTTMRYQTDFAVSLSVLALGGLLVLERGLRRRAWLLAPVVAAVCAVTVVVGTLVSFDYHSRSMHTTAPLRWQALARSTHAGLSRIGHWLGRVEGPRVLKVRFKAQPAGTTEVFWTSLDPRVDERIMVEHIGDHLIRFGYARRQDPVQWGRPLKWEDNHTHTVEVQAPSLYPGNGRGWWAGVRKPQEFRQRTSVAVWFSGGRALSAIAPLPPADITPGGAFGKDFSGEARQKGSRLYRDDEIIAGGLVDPWAKRGGILRMRVMFHNELPEEGEPLFVTGAHYRSNILFVQPAPGGVKIVFENYTIPRVESAVFQPAPGGHWLEFEMASFNPKAFGKEATGPVVVRLDGKEILRTTQVGYEFYPSNEEIGHNSFGTTCAAEFRGWILEARWINASSAPGS